VSTIIRLIETSTFTMLNCIKIRKYVRLKITKIVLKFKDQGQLSPNLMTSMLHHNTHSYQVTSVSVVLQLFCRHAHRHMDGHCKNTLLHWHAG